MKKIIRNLLLSLLPLLIGGGIYIVLQTWFYPVPLLIFKVDIGTALAVIGAVGSVILLSGWLGWELSGQRWTGRLIDVYRAQEDARRRFIRRLDHELKNPLTGLRIALVNLGAFQNPSNPELAHSLDETAPSVSGRGGPPREPVPARLAPTQQDANQALNDAEMQTERLSRLIADLRKLAELEERPLELAPVDLAGLLEETVTAVCGLPQYTRRAVSLVIPRVPWPLSAVNGDSDLLGLVFYNLIENALKYSEPGDAVEVRAVEDGRWVIVEVADSGPGIAGEDLPRIFEELYRGANARGLEGSGLGLALVRRVIDRHGGEISVRSRQSGQKGTVFRVRLRRQGS